MRERAGVIVICDGRVALIERVRGGRTYWVVPGGGVEPGESVADAAVRETAEELGAAAELGPLRVQFDAIAENGAHGRHWYFAASIETDDIRIVGPELDEDPSKGTYAAVWIDLADLPGLDVRPPEIASLIVAHGADGWPVDPIRILTDQS